MHQSNAPNRVYVPDRDVHAVPDTLPDVLTLVFDPTVPSDAEPDANS
jgi:hypothetical protein